MAESKPVSMLVVYRIKEGTEARFLPLLEAHWPALSRAGLVTAEPAKAWRAVNKRGGLAFVETFQWKDAGSSEVAHQTPEIMKLWEPMGPFLEGLDLYMVEPLAL
jgi:hypothetical protein